MDSIHKADALKQMRILTNQNIPFSIGFITYTSKDSSSKGYRIVRKAMLRTGLRADQSEKHNILIAYTSYDKSEEESKHFYYPLLMMFNGKKVLP